MLVENKHGHGAFKNKLDLRDRKYHKTSLAKAAIPFDWSKGYSVEEDLGQHLGISNFRIPVKDQGTSDSCVGQASSYYESVQDAFEKGIFTQKSARDAYSQIFYPNGGSTTRDALKLLTSKGICQERYMPPCPSEFCMRSGEQTSASIADALTSKGVAYATVAINMDSIAEAVRDNHGILLAVTGENNGTWLSATPQPPRQRVWGHELFVCGAKMIKGKKYLVVLNSWGTDIGDQGHQYLGEDYLPFIHSTGVLYDSTIDALKAEKTLLERLLELLQKMINYAQMVHYSLTGGV